ncbi:MAG TPA: hypothetical protein VIK52_01455, partial [Opitutaceae bacterium]
MLWTPTEKYFEHPFENESQLEAAITEVTGAFFGPDRIYLDVKKLVGAKGKTRNIPDGYLIDLTSRHEPKLFVVEVELQKHHPLNHIAVQILEFSLSFGSAPFLVKGILKDALKGKPDAMRRCDEYATANDFDNVDHLLERILQEKDAFNALVIIDVLDDELETLLMSRFSFPVEILTLERFRTPEGRKAYFFTPFLSDVVVPSASPRVGLRKVTSSLDPSEIDTIVVPAQKDGFEQVFLGENRWYQIRIHSSMVPRIKYVAAYRTVPVSSITHVA